MGVAGRRQRDFDYSGVASSNVFRQALDDSDTDDDGARQGRVNYVALAEKDKRQDDVDDVIDAVEQSTDDKLEAYDEHFEEMQRRRKLVVQGNSGNVDF